MEHTIATPARKAYPSDLRGAEWTILEPLVPAVKPGGRPARHSRREIVNAILYVVRGGNQWRAMPHDLPPWQTAFYYFRIWRNDGTWERIHTALRERTRRRVGREAPPARRFSTASRSKPGKGGPPRLRRPQASERTQATSVGGYAGLRAQGGRLGRRWAGPRRRAVTGSRRAALWAGLAAPRPGLGGCRLRRATRGRPAPADGLDGGGGQALSGAAPHRLCRAAAPLDR